MKLICFFISFAVIKAEFWSYYDKNNDTLLIPNAALLERDEQDDPQKYFDGFLSAYKNIEGNL